MGTYTLYRAYYKQRRPKGSSDSWQMVLPMEISYTDGNGNTTVIEQNSTKCGYEPEPEAQYRWVNLPITSDYECDENYSKYYKQKRQVSMDNGATWNDVTPYTTQRGSLYETESIDCGYVEPVKIKFIVDKYYSGVCDGSTELTQTEVCSKQAVNGEAVPRPKELYVGDCVEIIGEGGTTRIGSTTSNAWYAELTKVELGENVKEIKGKAFEYADFRDIELDAALEKIGVYAFQGSMLSSITFPQSVKYIGNYIANYCPIEYFVFEGTTPPEVDLTFESNVHGIPVFVKDSAHNDYKTALPSFSGAIMPESRKEVWANLTYGTKTLEAPIEYTWYGSDFYPYFTSLTEEKVLDIRKLMNSEHGIIGACIGKNITSIGSNAFAIRYSNMGTTNWRNGTLRKLTFEEPSSLTHIGAYAFKYAFSTGSSSSLFEEDSTLRLPEGLVGIGYEAFCKNSFIEDIYLPSTLEYIDSYAFAYYSGTRNVYIYCTTPPRLGTDVFKDDGWGAPLNIYVPSGSVEAYKSASGWSTYASRIQAMP